MMVLISYDVSTTSPAGKNGYEKLQKNVRIMLREFKILFLKQI